MQDWLPKLTSRERWYAEHFITGISVENLLEDGHFTRYDVHLLEWWNLYHYYDLDYNLLPKAKDGGLSYGLIQSMKAIDGFYRSAKEYEKTVKEEIGDNSEEEVRF